MSDPGNTDVAIVASAHVNAVGIAQSLREIGWKGPIVCIGSIDSVAARFPRVCTLWPIDPPAPSDLLAMIVGRFGASCRKHLFFTHEAYLPTIAADRGEWTAANVNVHVGSVAHLDAVLDRMAFYRFIEQRSLAPVPMTLAHGVDPMAEFGGRFRARVWQSWDGNRRLNRGMNVRSPEDFERWRSIVVRDGLPPESLGYQELLSTDPMDNVSISGWHDAQRRLYVATRKVYQVDDNGRIVERIAASEPMCAATGRILDAMEYRGPFEMEFIVDAAGGFKVIELNPRFWMQHRLIAALSDNALVRAYTGQTFDMHLAETGKRYWLDPEVIAADLARGRHLWLLPRLRSCVWGTPPVGVVVRTVRHDARQVARRFAGRVGRLVCPRSVDQSPQGQASSGPDR